MHGHRANRRSAEDCGGTGKQAACRQGFSKPLADGIEEP
jgi:hypothetical protein